MFWIRIILFLWIFLYNNLIGQFEKKQTIKTCFYNSLLILLNALLFKFCQYTFVRCLCNLYRFSSCITHNNYRAISEWYACSNLIFLCREILTTGKFTKNKLIKIAKSTFSFNLYKCTINIKKYLRPLLIQNAS